MRKFLAPIAALVLAACGGDFDAYDTTATAAAAAKQAPKLNLSHVECNEDGTVNAHFVLLFAGDRRPGAISGTNNGSSFGPVDADKLSGNVWHYNVTLPSGYVDVTAATTTTSSGASVSLHNPGEYAGTYQCGVEPPECIVEATPGVLCLDTPLGNPENECAFFGLALIEKTELVSGRTHVADTDAALALVKSGSGGNTGVCGPGQASYNVYVNVLAGNTLESPSRQNISHVTYCACPAQ